MEYNIIKQKISAHPLIAGIERTVVIDNVSLQPTFRQIAFDAHVEYSQNGKDVTAAFVSKIPNWYVNNNYTVEARDGEAAAMRAPAFDYFWAIIKEKYNFNGLAELLAAEILRNDRLRYYDQLLGIAPKPPEQSEQEPLHEPEAEQF